MPLPNLIIGGVHKAGTTSVFSYLSIHPDVCGSSTKEIGFFMPLIYGKQIPTLNEYAEYFSSCSGSKKYFLEASPSYLYGKEVIANRIQKELGNNTKMIFIFRNPADRVFSFFERKKANAYLKADISFGEFINRSVNKSDEEIKEHRDDDDALFTRGIREGFYVNYLPCWFEKFGSNMKVMFFEDLKKDASAFMKDLCHWLEIDFRFYKPEDFVVENQTIAYKNRGVHRLLLQVNKNFENFWRSNRKLKQTLREWYKKINASNSRRERMSDEEREQLEKLYKPYNAQLAVLLKEKGFETLPAWLS